MKGLPREWMEKLETMGFDFERDEEEDADILNEEKEGEFSKTVIRRTHPPPIPDGASIDFRLSSEDKVSKKTAREEPMQSVIYISMGGIIAGKESNTSEECHLADYVLDIVT